MKDIDLDQKMETIRETRQEQGKRPLGDKILQMMAAAQTYSLDLLDRHIEHFPEVEERREIYPEDLQLGRWWRLNRNGDLTYVSRVPGRFDTIVTVGPDLAAKRRSVRSL